MAPPTARATSVERLAASLLDDASDAGLRDELVAWLSGSNRFRAFVEANAGKIRKKLHGARDADARRDVRAELLAARLLLHDRRFELAFEAYGSGRLGPDFTITFREGARVNLEVTRLRRPPGEASEGGWLAAKLRQLPPSVPAALLVAVDGPAAGALDVDAAVRRLRERADRKDEPWFTSRGFDGSRGFYERFLRLGAVLAWCEDAGGDARAASWVNVSARIPLPAPVLRACLACLRAGAG